jgi:hypothetical protein
VKKIGWKTKSWLTVLAVSPLCLALFALILNLTITSITGHGWSIVSRYTPYLALIGLGAVAIDLVATWFRKRAPGAAWIERQIGLPPDAIFLLWFTNHSTRLADVDDLNDAERALVWSSPIVKELLKGQVLVVDDRNRAKMKISRRTYRWLTGCQERFDEVSGKAFTPWKALTFGKTMFYTTASKLFAKQMDFLTKPRPQGSKARE